MLLGFCSRNGSLESLLSIWCKGAKHENLISSCLGRPPGHDAVGQLYFALSCIALNASSTRFSLGCPVSLVSHHVARALPRVPCRYYPHLQPPKICADRIKRRTCKVNRMPHPCHRSFKASARKCGQWVRLPKTCYWGLLYTLFWTIREIAGCFFAGWEACNSRMSSCMEL